VNQETEEEAVLLSMVTYLCDDNAIDPDQERGLVIPHLKYSICILEWSVVLVVDRIEVGG
jgi:hypothetical protein